MLPYNFAKTRTRILRNPYPACASLCVMLGYHPAPLKLMLLAYPILRIMPSTGGRFSSVGAHQVLRPRIAKDTLMPSEKLPIRFCLPIRLF